MHGALDLIDNVVNDRVQTDVHFFAIGQFGGFSLRPNVETDDDRVGRRRQQHVGFSNGADARMHDADLYLVGAELVQHFRQRFLRALNVALQDQTALP